MFSVIWECAIVHPARGVSLSEYVSSYIYTVPLPRAALLLSRATRSVEGTRQLARIAVCLSFLIT